MWTSATNVLVVGRRGSGKEAFVSNLLLQNKKLTGAVASTAKKTPVSYDGIVDTRYVIETSMVSAGNMAIATQKIQENAQIGKEEVDHVALVFDQSSDWWEKSNSADVLNVVRVAGRLNIFVILCVFDVKQVPAAFTQYIDVVCFAKDEFHDSLVRSYKRFGSFCDKEEFKSELGSLARFEFFCIDQRADAAQRSQKIIATKHNISWCENLRAESVRFGNTSKPKTGIEVVTGCAKEHSLSDHAHLPNLFTILGIRDTEHVIEHAS